VKFKDFQNISIMVQRVLQHQKASRGRWALFEDISMVFKVTPRMFQVYFNVASNCYKRMAIRAEHNPPFRNF
jgi:hypothetical protein